MAGSEEQQEQERAQQGRPLVVAGMQQHNANGGGVRHGGEGGEEELVVGYAFLAKKMGTMGKIVHQAAASASASSASSSSSEKHAPGPRIRFTPIDVDRPLEEQGPFDAILHKLSEDVVRRAWDPAAARRLANLEGYVAAHRGTAIIEHPRDVARIVSRTTTCETLRALSDQVPDAGVRPPRFFLLEAPPPDPAHSPEDDARAVAAHARAAIAAAPFAYPVIGKPVVACGTSRSHQLVVLGGEDGATELLTRDTLPMVIQEYANHDGVLFKVYVLGHDTSAIRVFERSSLPNLGPRARSVAFDSQRPYPQRADFLENSESKEEEEANGGSEDGDEDESDAEEEEEEEDGRRRRRLVLSAEGEARIARAARLIGRAFNLEIFGFDVLVPASNTSTTSTTTSSSSSSTGAEAETSGEGQQEWLVVDVNYFPSFKEVEDFPQLIHAFLRERVRQHRAGLTQQEQEQEEQEQE